MQNTTEITKPSRGRPRKANALTNAQRQQRWRAKQRERNEQMYQLIVKLLSSKS